MDNSVCLYVCAFNFICLLVLVLKAKRHKHWRRHWAPHRTVCAHWTSFPVRATRGRCWPDYVGAHAALVWLTLNVIRFERAVPALYCPLVLSTDCFDTVLLKAKEQKIRACSLASNIRGFFLSNVFFKKIFIYLDFWILCTWDCMHVFGRLKHRETEKAPVTARIHSLQQASLCPSICSMSLLCHFPFVSRLRSDKIIFTLFISPFPFHGGTKACGKLRAISGPTTRYWKTQECSQAYVHVHRATGPRLTAKLQHLL